MVLQIHDAVRDIPYHFRPVVHLRTGGVMALEAHVRPAEQDVDHLRPVTGIAERSAQLDVRFAAEATHRAAEHGNFLPLHLSLWADTVCGEHNPLRPLLDTLADLGRAPDQVVIRLVIPPGEPAPAEFETGLARLRAAGLGLGLDVAGTHPMSTLIGARPEVLLLAARHTRGLPTTPATRAVLAGSIALAKQIGAKLIADGCDTAEQAAALRARGVYLVQGQLLGPSRHRPHTQPVPAVVLDQLTTPAATGFDAPTMPSAPPAHDSTVETDSTGVAVAADLAHPAATMPADVTGEAARAVFASRPELTGLVLVDQHQRALLTLNRDRFMLAITGPFGHSLYAKRPAAGLADSPRTLGLESSLPDVIDIVANTPDPRMHDDLVVIDENGRCQGVLRIGDLVRDLAQRQVAHPSGRAPAETCSTGLRPAAPPEDERS